MMAPLVMLRVAAGLIARLMPPPAVMLLRTKAFRLLLNVNAVAGDCGRKSILALPPGVANESYVAMRPKLIKVPPKAASKPVTDRSVTRPVDSVVRLPRNVGT